MINVYDNLGNRRTNITAATLHKMGISDNAKSGYDEKFGADVFHEGGTFFSDDNAHFDFADSGEEDDELNDDWTSSSKIMKKHITFDQVLTAHDYTFVYFYTEHCPQCKKFGKTWDKFEKFANSKGVYRTQEQRLTFHVIKVNCGEFSDVCRENKVYAYPTIRMYHKEDASLHFSEYHGERSKSKLISYLEHELKEGLGAHDDSYTLQTMHGESCRLRGVMHVPRTPGSFVIRAGSVDHTIDARAANTSHIVHWLGFGKKMGSKRERKFPRRVRRYLRPMNEHIYIAAKLHQAPQHHLKLVPVKMKGQKDLTYQFEHSHAIHKVNKKEFPEAKFSYEISPLGIEISKEQMPLYDFLTKFCALIGGAYTVIHMLNRSADVALDVAEMVTGKKLM